MLLRDFIQTTLSDVSAAVRAAQSKDVEFEIDTRDGRGITFDVAVTAEDKKSAGGSARLGLSVLGAWGVRGSKSKNTSRTHRIQFTVLIRKKRDGTIVSKGMERKSQTLSRVE